MKSKLFRLWSVLFLVGLLNSFSSESFFRLGESLFVIYIGFRVIDGLSCRMRSFLGEMYDSIPKSFSRRSSGHYFCIHGDAKASVSFILFSGSATKRDLRNVIQSSE